MAEQMADAPDDIVVDVFTNNSDGVFGRFEAGANFEVDHLLTALRLAELECCHSGRALDAAQLVKLGVRMIRSEGRNDAV